MPNVIDSGDTEREDLFKFLEKHLPYNFYLYEKTGKTRFFWQTGQVIGYGFTLTNEDEEEVDVAEIQIDQPNTIILYDRSFMEDFVDLATKYERYNPNVTVTVIVKAPKDE